MYHNFVLLSRLCSDVYFLFSLRRQKSWAHLKNFESFDSTDLRKINDTAKVSLETHFTYTGKLWNYTSDDPIFELFEQDTKAIKL